MFLLLARITTIMDDCSHVQMNEDMKQMSKGYETARTKGTFKARRPTKQIYTHNKTCIDTLKYY